MNNAGTMADLSTILYSSAWTIVVVLLLVFLLFYGTPRRAKNLPPGPRPWPIIGNLPLLAKNPIYHWGSLKKEYGDIYSLYILSYPLIVLHSYDAIREAFVNKGDVLSDRPWTILMQEYSKHKGIILSSGILWKEQRRFALGTLRDFGFGKTNLEDKIMDEVGVYIQKLDELDGKPFDIRYLTHTSVSNIICSIVFGQRFQHDDPKFISYIDTLHENSVHASSFRNITLTRFPWLRYFPGDFFRHKRSKRNMRYLLGFIGERISQHANTLDPENPRDFIDVYIVRMREESGKPNSTFGEDQLAMIVFDLFFAGTETTSSTILWMILYLCKNPDIQLRIHEELDEIIGKDRNPSCGDRPKFPFTDACIRETQRFADIVPMGVSHAASEDCYFRGYFIPKGAAIMPFLRGVHYDKEYWGDPDVFRPSRFLDDNGKLKKFDYFIPFSIGRRQCIGESLAKMELFLFVTSILKRFTFSFREDVQPPGLKGILGITVSPPLYEVCCRRRCQE